MADTVTPLLGLVKPEIGASSDSWGNKLNGNFDVLDKAIRNTAQWTMALGDGVPTSSTGPFVISRYDNSVTKIDEPFSINRQTGEVNILKALNTPVANTGVNVSAVGRFPYQSAAPAPPGAGFANVFFDVQGNAVIQRPDGSIQYLGIPPGVITFTGASAPDAGWALLNGQAISRANNPVVFAKFGLQYGAGDGSTTFNLPDAKGRVFFHVDSGAGRLTGLVGGVAIPGGIIGTLGSVGGEEAHKLILAETPSKTISGTTGDDSPDHSHAQNGNTMLNGIPVGNFQGGANPFGTGGSTGGASNRHQHSFSASNGGGDGSHNNTPPGIVLNAQVKLG